MLLTKLWMEVMEDTEAKLQMSLKACIMSIYHPHTHTHACCVQVCVLCFPGSHSADQRRKLTTVVRLQRTEKRSWGKGG